MVRQGEAISPAMKTEASKTRSLEIAFVVSASDLEQLENILREIGDTFEYQVRFSDGHTLQYHDIADVLKQQNSQTRSIVSVIAGVTGPGKRSAYVVLKDGKSSHTSYQPFNNRSVSLPSIEYTVNGTQKDAIYVGDKLDEWTAGIRQWYSVFDRSLMQFLLAAIIIFGPIWLWNNASPYLFPSGFIKSHNWVEGVTVIGIWVAVFLTFKLFPRATFAVGQGVQRHQFTTYLRNSVLGAFLLSTLASLLANWLTRRQ
jgi:hypothetical protein